MKLDLRTWLLVIDWIRKNRPSVLDEACNAVSNKIASDSAKPNADSALELSPRGRQIYLKKFGGNETLLEERLALARDAYLMKPPDYRFKTPFITFFERRVEVDLRELKKTGEIAPERNSRQEIWQNQVLATVDADEEP